MKDWPNPKRKRFEDTLRDVFMWTVGAILIYILFFNNSSSSYEYDEDVRDDEYRVEELYR